MLATNYLGRAYLGFGAYYADVVLASFTLDGEIAPTFGYNLDTLGLSRPTAFNRQYIHQKTDYTSINGKSSRDTSSLKEKFMLRYDYVTKQEVDDLMAVINLNIPVIFVVNDHQLSISTMVFPYVGSIVYSIVGGDYLASLQLELIEEV